MSRAVSRRPVVDRARPRRASHARLRLLGALYRATIAPMGHGPLWPIDRLWWRFLAGPRRALRQALAPHFAAFPSRLVDAWHRQAVARDPNGALRHPLPADAFDATRSLAALLSSRHEPEALVRLVDRTLSQEAPVPGLAPVLQRLARRLQALQLFPQVVHGRLQAPTATPTDLARETACRLAWQRARPLHPGAPPAVNPRTYGTVDLLAQCARRFFYHREAYTALRTAPDLRDMARRILAADLAYAETIAWHLWQQAGAAVPNPDRPVAVYGRLAPREALPIGDARREAARALFTWPELAVTLPWLFGEQHQTMATCPLAEGPMDPDLLVALLASRVAVVREWAMLQSARALRPGTDEGRDDAGAAERPVPRPSPRASAPRR